MATCPKTPPFVSGLCLGLTVHRAGRVLLLTGSFGPITHPVKGPDTHQWSIEAVCLLSWWTPVYYWVAIPQAPSRLQYHFILNGSLFPDWLWGLESSLFPRGIPILESLPVYAVAGLSTLVLRGCMASGWCLGLPW